MKILLSLFFVLTIALSSPSSAERWPTAELLTPPLQETLIKEVPVSGSVLAGVADKKVNISSMQFPQIFAYAPAIFEEKTICLTVSTRDGTYRSENTFKLPSLAESTYVGLPYPTKYGELLRNQERTDVALLARIGECINSQDDVVLVAAWGDRPEARPDTLVVALNAGRASASLRLQDRVDKTYDCALIRIGRRTVFDSICNIQITDVAEDSINVIIIERKYGEQFEVEAFKVWVGF